MTDLRRLAPKGDARQFGLARIEGTLARDNGPSEIGDVVLDYIPGHSAREGGLFFTEDPQAGRLAWRATGFAKP